MTVEENDVRARLRALTLDDKRRPETARLRDVFDDVEGTLRKGFSQVDVLAELHQAGFTMTMASFKSALQRIRKERSQGGDKRSSGNAETTNVQRTNTHAAPAKTAPPKAEGRPATGFIPKPVDLGDESKLI